MQEKIKEICLICLALTFGALILGISVIRTAAKTNPNYKTIVTTNTVSDSLAVPTPTPVDYFLPYPGTLPDNPFYFLKMVRDRVVLTLTFDQIKKSEMLILFADKRLGAGKALIEGGKIDLGLETLTKGEKYLEQAALEIEKATKAGKETHKVSENIAVASLKHQEVLTSLLPRVPDEARPMIENSLRYSRQVSQQFSETKN